VVAYDIAALMDYKGWSVEKAAKYVVQEKLKSQQAEGGVIALDKKGNFTIQFNTTGMFRGYIKSNGEMKVMIFK